MSARILREQGVVIQLEFIGDVLQAAGMLMTAVKHHDGFACRAMHRWPMAVEQFNAIVRGKYSFFGDACHEVSWGLRNAERARLKIVNTSSAAVSAHSKLM